MPANIRKLFAHTTADVVLLRTAANACDPNFSYFCGLDPERFANNILLLEKNASKPTVIISPMEFDRALAKLNVRFCMVRTQKQFERFVKQKIRGKIVGINFESYPHGRVRALKKTGHPKKIVDVSRALGNVRAAKTKSEINKIKNACKITEEIFEKVPFFLKKNKTEIGLAMRMQTEAFKTVDELAYPPIVAFGAHSGVAHHIPQKTRIGKNNFLLVDFGVKFKGYCSDITRTFFCGHPSEKQQWEYWCVWQAQQRAQQAARIGVRSDKLFRVADEFLFKALQMHIPHALGHGIGLDIHDFPTRIAIGEKWEVKKNHVLTLEPAFYTKQYGIRIEDDIFIQQNAARWLTQTPPELMLL